VNGVQAWLIVAAGFFVLACVEMYWQLRKGDSLWRAVRSWLSRIVDILSG
jgi:hypothetical protein